jgi:hypothetical protein
VSATYHDNIKFFRNTHLNQCLIKPFLEKYIIRQTKYKCYRAELSSSSATQNNVRIWTDWANAISLLLSLVKKQSL